MMRRSAGKVLGVVLRDHATRTIFLTLAYVVALYVSCLLAYQLRFDFDLPDWLSPTMLSVCATTVLVQLICLLLYNQFDGLLSYFSRPDLKRVVLACTTAAVVVGIIRLTMGVQFAPPRGVVLIDYVLSIVALSGMRLSFRQLRMLGGSKPARTQGKKRRVGIFGAGDCGADLAKEFLRKPWLGLQAVAFFDDFRDPNCRVHGIPLVGKPEQIPQLKEKLQLDEIIIAAPSASAKRVRGILKVAQEAGLSCLTVPSLDQLATGRCSVSHLRPVVIQDLLGRAPVEIENEEVRQVIEGRTVLVTGAGGSIGSELCRQILARGPAALVLLDRSEPQLFTIEQELRSHPNGTAICPIVADIARPERMRGIFRCYRPHLVFHAAAHKHVPMMELQPGEAVSNNVLGTALLADLASEFEVERFVFISTDKAVNPTSVMGATKRVAETYVQSLATTKTSTRFMAVRFGNVLGSSGSVVPTFERQIAAGGPVTVTHPEVTRYFMTISEAVTLVLQSSAFGQAGDIFVLDMGKPVRILDMALQMIALAGLRPYDDIEIAFTGLRPGEKLYEELCHGGEDVTTTPHSKIARLVCAPTPHQYVDRYLHELMQAVESDAEPTDLKLLLGKILPEYCPFEAATPPPAPAPETAPQLFPPLANVVFNGGVVPRQA